MATITLPDGTTIPEYALESTQAEIMKLLLAQVKSDSKQFTLYQELVNNSKKQLANQEDQEDLQEENIKLLQGIRDDAKRGKSILGRGMEGAGAAANFTADKLIGLSKVAAGAALTGFTVIAKSAYNVGNTLADLGLQAGIGLSGIGDTTVSTIANLNRLGLTSAQAAGLMAQSSGTIAAIGQQQFVQVNTALAQMTSSGAKFGMTMSELAGIAAEDLETRQKLGILDNLNAATAAKRSNDLFQQQLSATQILGKSIDEIRNASKATLQENAQFALRVQSIAAKMPNGAEVARAFTAVIEGGLGSLAGTGLSQNLINGIGSEIGAAVAFASDSGQELFRTLNYVNPALTESVRNMNDFAKAGDVDAVDAEMKKFQKTLLDTAADMSAEEFDALSGQLLAGSMGQAGKDFALSLGELRIASQKFGKVQAAAFGDLAQGSKTFDNAMAQMSGGISGLFTDMAGVLGPAVGGVADAFNDVTDESGKVTEMGISSAFKKAMSDISGAFSTMLGGTGSDFSSLSDAIRRSVVPKIQAFADWFAGDGIKKLKNAFDFIGGMMSGFGEVLGFVKYLITDKLMPAFSTIADMLGFNKQEVDADGNVIETSTNFADLGKKVALSIAAFIALTKTVKLVSAGMGAMKAVGGLFGGGGAAASAAGSAGGAAGGAAAKTGAGIAKLGKGIGRGVGAIFSGLGKGLAAVPAAALKGATYIAGAIAILAGGVKAAAFILNLGGEDGLKQLSSGFASFNDIDGMNLISVGAGLTALGVGLAAFGAGSVMGALGNLVGGLMDSMNEFFGGTSIFDKIQEFGNYNFPVDRIKNNADAVVAYGLAMGAIGAGQGLGSVGNLISGIVDSVVSLFGGETPLEKVQSFGEMTLNKEGIMANGDAIAEYAIAMARLGDIDVPGATIASFLGDIGQGILSFMGASSPAEKLAEFGGMNINATGVMVNSQAVLAYAQAMSALKGVDVGNLSSATSGLMDDASLEAFEKLKEFGELDIGSFSVRENSLAIAQFASGMKEMQEVDAELAAENITKLSKAYQSFNMLNPERLVAVADGMAKINQNALKGVSLSDADLSVALGTGLTNVGASPQPSAEAVTPPLLPGEKTSPTPPSEKEGESVTEIALLRKIVTNLDTLNNTVNTKL